MNLKSYAFKIMLFIKEKHYQKQVKYLFFKRNHSDSLIVVFSGFSGNNRRYNYIKSFASLRIDKLYVLDTWGYQGSYYLFENGDRRPERLVDGLLEFIIGKRKYKNVYFAGSSKGGTAAIYYGLKHDATDIFAGACQYNIGDYLHRNDHESIFRGMMGDGAGDQESEVLNNIIKNRIRESANSSTVIHLIYSKGDLTYKRHIIDLIKDLEYSNIKTMHRIEVFSEHSDIGIYFPKYVVGYLNREA